MTESDRTDLGGAAVPAAAPGPATAGGLLRAAREAQGLHIAALATAIKVTPRKVDALEGNRLHELPDVTFARALAKTICRQLKIDPTPVLALLPASGTIALEPASRIQSTPYRDRGGRADQNPGRHLGPLIWGAVLLLLAAAAVMLLPASGFWGLGTEISAPEQPASGAVPAPPSPAASPAVPNAALPTALPGAAPSLPVTAPASAASVVQFALTSTGPATVAASPSAGPVPAAVAETVFSAPPPVAGLAPAVSGALVVTTTDASWVEVRDARGQMLLSETVQPGRSIGVDGALPFRLLVGNAAATQLVFKGRAVDVMARARENVARFELQ